WTLPFDLDGLRRSRLPDGTSNIPDRVQAIEPDWEDPETLPALAAESIRTQPSGGAAEVPPGRREVRLSLACRSLIGTIAWFSGTAVAVRRFHRLLRFARPAPAALQREVSELALRLGLTDSPGLWLVPGAVSPMLWAIGRARLLFPAELLGPLDGTQPGTPVAPAPAHLPRRRQLLPRLVALVLGVYRWHPATVGWPSG